MSLFHKTTKYECSANPSESALVFESENMPSETAPDIKVTSKALGNNLHILLFPQS